MMSKNLPSIHFGVTGFPASMLSVFALSNVYHAGIVKTVLPAKCTNPMNDLLNTIRRCNDVSPLAGLTKSITHLFTYRMSKASCTHVLDSFWTMFFAKTVNSHFLAGFKRSFLATARSRLTKMSISQCFFDMWKHFRSQARTSNTVKIEAFVAKWFELIKPVLLTCRQQFRNKHQLNHFKDEGLRTILVPCALQLGVSVSTFLEKMLMYTPAVLQIDGTTNVELACNRANDAVYARSGGDRIGVHASKLLRFSSLCWVSSGSQGRSFSCPMISQALDDLSSITFFPTACKAEGGSSHNNNKLTRKCTCLVASILSARLLRNSSQNYNKALAR